MIGTIARYGVVVAAFAALAACAPAPAYYPAYPAYHARPVHPPASQAPSQAAISTQSPQSNSDWVNPEPAR
jgi:hypothetical protein